MAEQGQTPPSAPPLPPGPPPGGPAPSMQPPLPPQMGYYPPGPHHHHPAGVPYEAGMPPVAALLMREADAWRGLLGLHAGVLSTARQLAAATSETETGTTLEATRDAIEAREAGYYASLTQLAAQCDQLAAEALRLRGLRKARQGADVQALQVLMQSHSSETLAVGGTLAANSGVAVQAVTAELRQATASTRQQLAQVRAVLQLVQDKPALRGELTLGYRDWMVTPDEVFEEVYRESEQLTDEALVRALNTLVECASPEREAPSPSQRGSHSHGSGGGGGSGGSRQRQLVRRPADGRHGGPGR